MRKKIGMAAALVLLAAGAVIFTVPAFAGNEQMGYWDKFKTVFVDWDDNPPAGKAHTEVTGVRGMNVEQALGPQGYDWAAVWYMEDYKVSVDDEMKFLQDGKLGPFQGN